MASGGFHGGSSHSGGFHSSGGGGFHGGGFSGGGFSGGSHYSSGGHYSGGGSGGGDGGGLILLFGWGPLLIMFYASCGAEVYLGLNYLNILIFWISGILFYIAGKQYERTAVIEDVKRDCNHRILGYVWHGSLPSFLKNTDQKTWAGEYCDYKIVFYDKEYGEHNARMVGELIQRTPKIIWAPYQIWVVIGILSFIVTLFFYEAVIPFFENAIMSDVAFEFFDNLVFYFPSIICGLSAITSLVIVAIKDSLLYECAVRIVHDNMAAQKKIRTETQIANKMSEKWYYNICPNCGANGGYTNRFCHSCGSSLEVNEFNGSISGFHRITEYGEKANKEQANKEK